jgi:hypothetical protein
MEHRVRVLNERDRQTLQWLRGQLGDAALEAAALRIGTATRKPYVSQLCQALGLEAPQFEPSAPVAPTPVGERALATIRAMLVPKAATSHRQN